MARLHSGHVVDIYTIEFQKPCKGSTIADARLRPKMGLPLAKNCCTRLTVDGTQTITSAANMRNATLKYDHAGEFQSIAEVRRLFGSYSAVVACACRFARGDP